ncbi:hypothetical protein JYT61_01275, partial [bacterium AH-315-E10]|nr:hypothetical protein [bacterium AH-315-E10]
MATPKRITIIVIVCTIGMLTSFTAAFQLLLMIALLHVLLHSPVFRGVGVYLLGIVCFILAFLMNPIAWYTAAKVDGTYETTGDGVYQGIIFIVGFIWSILLARLIRTDHKKKVYYAPQPKEVVLYMLLFTAMIIRAWYSELTVNGDESFHVMSIQFYHLLIQDLFGLSFFLLLWGALATLITGILLRKERVILFGGLLTLVIAAALGGMYSLNTISMENLVGYPVRYPAFQYFINACLAHLPFSNWEFDGYHLIEQTRLLTVFMSCVIGYVFLWDFRWRDVEYYWKLGAVMMIMTVPCFVFFQHLSYLDIAVVCCSTVVLFDIKRLLRARVCDLGKHASCLALIALPFMKESALPIVMLLLIFRLANQLWTEKIKSTDASYMKVMQNELCIILLLLLPLGLYLYFRNLDGSRPYGGEFMNLLSITEWFDVMTYIIQQVGIIIVLAVYGGVVLWKKGERLSLLLYLAFFIGMKAFFLCDSTAWNSLARFNLYVLPPLFVLSWNGLTELKRLNKQYAVLTCIIVIACNFAMWPIDIETGRGKQNWDHVNLLQYPFANALLDLKQDNSKHSIYIMNMPDDYAFYSVFSELLWKTNFAVSDSLEGETEGQKLVNGLIKAYRKGSTSALFRSDQIITGIEVGQEI